VQFLIAVLEDFLLHAAAVLPNAWATLPGMPYLWGLWLRLLAASL